MTVLTRLFGARAIGGFELKFSQLHGQWQVYSDNRLIYLGEKVDCQKFLDNAAALQGFR